MIYLDYPLFQTIKERNQLPMTYVRDIVSFIHLVRLGLPVTLWRPCTDKRINAELEAQHYYQKIEGSYCDLCLIYHPDQSYVQHSVIEFNANGDLCQTYPYYYMLGSPSEWRKLLEDLKQIKYSFRAPPNEIDLEITKLKVKQKTKKEVYIMESNLGNGEISRTELLALVRQYPILFAPSPKFKGKSDTVFSANDLPFDA